MDWSLAPIKWVYANADRYGQAIRKGGFVRVIVVDIFEDKGQSRSVRRGRQIA